MINQQKITEDGDEYTVEEAVVRIYDIKRCTTNEDGTPFAILKGHDGKTYSAWGAHYNTVDRAKRQMLGRWFRIRYVENDGFRNVRAFLEPDPSELPDGEREAAGFRPVIGAGA